MAKYFLRIGERELEAEIEETPLGLRVNIDGVWRVAGLERLPGSPRYILTLDDRIVEVLVEEETHAFQVHIAGRSYEVETSRGRARRREEQRDQFEGGRWRLVSPLTGVVTEVRVAPGQDAEKGQVLLVVEAMKMLNELRARVSGRIAEVLVAARDRVEIGQPLVTISEIEGASGPGTGPS